MLLFLLFCVGCYLVYRWYDPDRAEHRANREMQIKVYREMQHELHYLIARIEGRVAGPFDPESGLPENEVQE